MTSNTFIVLATHNGAAHLAPQLDSLLAQSVRDWVLLVRDDGSTDATPQIIAHYAGADDRIRAVPGPVRDAEGALANFSALLTAALESGADYVFCCDQDDVWEADKLERVLPRLKQAEGEGRAPALVHHDLRVVDEALRMLEPSFVGLMQLDPGDERNPVRLVSRNEVTGCAMGCNRALLEVALPVSPSAVMHDWWLALSAAFFGRLVFMPDILVSYRQHADNTIGAKSFWHGLNPFTNWVAGWRRGDREFMQTVEQANAFRESMGDRLPPDSPDTLALERYGGLAAASRRQRLQSLGSFGLWRNHWLLNVVLVMRMLLLPRRARP